MPSLAHNPQQTHAASGEATERPKVKTSKPAICSTTSSHCPNRGVHPTEGQWHSNHLESSEHLLKVTQDIWSRGRSHVQHLEVLGQNLNHTLVAPDLSLSTQAHNDKDLEDVIRQHIYFFQCAEGIMLITLYSGKQ